MLKVIQLLPKEMCLVLDTDDYIIEKVRMQDVAIAVSRGVEFSNVHRTEFMKENISAGKRFILRSLHQRYRTYKNDEGAVIIYIGSNNLIGEDKVDFISEDVFIQTWGCEITVWYKGYLYKVPEVFNTDLEHPENNHRIMLRWQAVGIYKDQVIAVDSILGSNSSHLIFNDGKVVCKCKKKKFEVKDAKIVPIDRRAFGRQHLMGKFKR